MSVRAGTAGGKRPFRECSVRPVRPVCRLIDGDDWISVAHDLKTIGCGSRALVRFVRLSFREMVRVTTQDGCAMGLKLVETRNVHATPAHLGRFWKRGRQSSSWKFLGSPDLVLLAPRTQVHVLPCSREPWFAVMTASAL